MEEKLKEEYYRLINQYRHTKSKVIKKNIVSSLEGIYDTCIEYGISIPKISNYIIGYNCDKTFWFECDDDSALFVNELCNKVLEKLQNQEYEVFNKINAKVNKEKYSNIIIEYLIDNKKELYDLYIKMEKENRFFYIETGYDNSDSDFFVIPYLHENKNLAVIDSYSTLSCYFGVIHELSHVHYNENYKYYGKIAKYDVFNNLTEVYPIYSELLFGEYLKKIKETDKNYAYLLAKNQLIYPDNNILEDYDIHFMGNVLALNFFDMYLEDKEKAEYNFEKFLKNNEGNDFNTNINSYGLSKEKILSLKAIER